MFRQDLDSPGISKTCPGPMGRTIKSNMPSLLIYGASFMKHSLTQNASKIPGVLRGIMLQSQLYARALDLCKSIPDSEVQSEDGYKFTLNAVIKRDAYQQSMMFIRIL